MDEPTLDGAWDALVDIGAAGLCRTDLHIIEGQWDPIQHPTLPYTIGHENAGRIREAGNAVSDVQVGDGGDHAPAGDLRALRGVPGRRGFPLRQRGFPGINAIGGMAEPQDQCRAVVKLDDDLRTRDVAALQMPA